MSSGDPLVDQEAQRLEALNNMLDSLTSKDTLVLEAAAATTANGDDPLVDAEEEARKKRDEMIDSLKGKGTSLEAASADDPLVVQDGQQDESDQLIQDLENNGDSLVAQQSTGAKTVEEALREMGGEPVADANLEVARRAAEADVAEKHVHKTNGKTGASEANRRMEANDPAAESETKAFGVPDISSWGNWFSKGEKKETDGKDRELASTETNEADRPGHALESDSWRHWLKLETDETDRRLGADETNHRHRGHHLEAEEADRSLKAAQPFARQLAASGTSAHASAVDIPQMFGGAFILVAVVALVAVVRRRRKPAAAPADSNRWDGHDYQLFM